MLTSFTQRYDVRVPVVCDPMAGIAGGALAAAVHRGGGLGAIGVLNQDQLAQEVKVARESLALKDEDPLPLLLGLICFLIESPHGSSTLVEPLLHSMVSLRPKAIWLSFGQQIEQHIRTIRILEQKLGVEKIKLIVMVGIEAGGPGLSLSSGGLPLFSLLPLVQQYFSTLTHPPLLLAAGGLSTPAHLLATLPFGCSAIVMGTVFLGSPEALYPDAFKNLLLTAKGSDTVRSAVWDQMRGDLGFGEGVDGRALRNESVGAEEEGVGEEAMKLKYDEKVKEGDQGAWKAVWAGTGVRLLVEIRSAEAIVQDFELGAEEGFKALARMSVSEKIEV